MKRYLLLLLMANTASASEISIGRDGINSKITGLDGSIDFLFQVNIAQIEVFRSGKQGYDLDSNAAPNTVPYEVYWNNGQVAPPDEQVNDHATMVAGVMIGNDSAGATYEGVAPKARLHSTASSNINDAYSTALAIQNMANKNVVPEMVAINFSFGFATDFPYEDGTSFQSNFVDWAAKQYDVAMVCAWPDYDVPPRTTPADNYNGITVGASAIGVDGKFSIFSYVNAVPDFAGTERTHIDLIAPGDQIQVLDTDQARLLDATSLAAPHVTGAIALLHAYREQQKNAGNPKFVGHPLKHYAVKAILMNSADKIAGVLDSNRDVLNHNHQRWDQTLAYFDDQVPLDADIGAGHLNVNAAVSQLAAGSYEPNIPNQFNVVPRKGWADEVIGPGEQDEYIFDANVGSATWIAATLCWDRSPQLTSGDTYHYGDDFLPYGDPYNVMADLDLYLVSVATGLPVASSIAFTHTEEHIFFKTTAAAERLKLVVVYAGGNQEFLSYGLAWWVDGVGVTGSDAGDFNNDGKVDTADYVLWRKDSASYGGAVGHEEWRTNFGVTYGSGSSLASIPEPSTLGLALIGFVLCNLRTKKAG